MSRALARKLSNFLELTDQDKTYLDRITFARETVPADRDIVGFGEVPATMFVIERGMAIRYRVLRGGERQILSFMLPGDLCDLNVFLLKKMDHNVASLEELEMSRIRRDDVLKTYFKRPRIAAALWWSALQAEAISREHIVALGRRRARSRLAYLFFDIYWRLKAVGLAEDNVLNLPLTQAEIGDALGLTPVHINRVLKELVEEGLIDKQRGQVQLLNTEALQKVADIDDHYLHLDAPPREIASYFHDLERLTDVSN
ncbi:hypothetical protein B5C34_11865 [Pacificimonas flava]|uniref:HTH crp-type domain-containing protein n=2 Tax=Pacificimonas TaxID=1960290 RepID=A0A219B6U2_9SPHN|nr:MULTISPECIES: Crp/Fnr family transcriptional regulator [Pacificimonas]MBZ6378640.1 Crp/Fnr family transcriptional regulator [Pacificimonas aurantium]OWV34087.1 hypothetical protein B5C34_11865 [Pacificimonas flava]